MTMTGLKFTSSATDDSDLQYVRRENRREVTRKKNKFLPLSSELRDYFRSLNYRSLSGEFLTILTNTIYLTVSIG